MQTKIVQALICHNCDDLSKFAFIRKEDFETLSNRPGLFFFSPGKKLLTLFVDQGWLDKRNTTFEALVQDPSVCGGS